MNAEISVAVPVPDAAGNRVVLVVLMPSRLNALVAVPETRTTRLFRFDQPEDMMTTAPLLIPCDVDVTTPGSALVIAETVLADPIVVARETIDPSGNFAAMIVLSSGYS